MYGAIELFEVVSALPLAMWENIDINWFLIWDVYRINKAGNFLKDMYLNVLR